MEQLKITWNNKKKMEKPKKMEIAKKNRIAKNDL